MNNSRRFCKSADDKAIFGVCGGIGEYFDIDSLIIRLIFVILFMAYGCGLGIYLILAIAMPKKAPEMRYAYSGAPGENYYGYGYPQAPESEAKAAAMEFSAQMSGETREEGTPWPQAEPKDEVPAEAQEAMQVMEAMEESAEADDLDPAPVINAQPETVVKEEAPKVTAQPQADAYRAYKAPQPPKAHPETGRYDKFAAYSSINQNAGAGQPGKPGKGGGRAAGVLLLVVGLIMVLKVLFPRISMALIAGIGMMAAGLYLIFKKN